MIFILLYLFINLPGFQIVHFEFFS